MQPNPQAPHIRCDATLQALFGESSVRLGSVQEMLKPHLTPPGPLVVDHTIR